MNEANLPIANIAAYKFVDLNAELLPALQQQLEDRARACNLKGTILLATEGINLFLAGERADIDTFWKELTAMPEFPDLTYKISFSARQPFRRLRVKIKREIIPSGNDGLHPASFPADRVAPAELKQWLDEKRDITLLDTRNDFEVTLGTFASAHALNIDSFRSFSDAVEELHPELKNQPTVIFCTGGIRCEKAAPLMAQKGFQQVYQLQGGILQYFEECGDGHFEGECFVFDDRIALDAQLRETGTILCERCQFPVTRAQQNSSRFVPGEYCPHCIDT